MSVFVLMKRLLFVSFMLLGYCSFVESSYAAGNNEETLDITPSSPNQTSSFITWGQDSIYYLNAISSAIFIKEKTSVSEGTKHGEFTESSASVKSRTFTAAELAGDPLSFSIKLLTAN